MIRKRLKKNYIFITGFFIGISYYFLESAIHYISEGFGHDYISHLFHLEIHEIYMRFALIIMIFLASLVVQIFYNRLHTSYLNLSTYKNLIAHDIRNIITNINISADLILNSFKNKINDDKFVRYIQIIKKQSIESNILLTNVLKLAQLKDQSKELFRKINVHNFLRSSREFILRNFLEKKVSINTQLLEKEVYTQANDLLGVVFNNLFYNAVIHNNSQNIDIFVIESMVLIKKKNFLKLEFKDNGIGIDSLKKKTIFSGKLLANGSLSSGMGIGLKLVNRIVASYGGFIQVLDRVEGDYTQGSNFVLFLKMYNSN